MKRKPRKNGSRTNAAGSATLDQVATMPPDDGLPFSLRMAGRIELWPIERLRPYSKNPRTHSPEQVAKIAASMAEFGFTNPVLVDSADGIIAGHGRLQAAQRLGLEQVPVVVLDHLTDAQRRAYVIADNKLALDAGWDGELLAAELAELERDGFDLGLTGFTDEELEEIWAEADAAVIDDDAVDAAPEPPETPISRPGDLWVLGRHRVLCGDSTSTADVARLMDGRVADCLWTDPPYNVAYEGAAGSIANDQMTPQAFGAFLAAAFDSAIAVLRPGAPAYVAHADTEGLAFRRAFVESGFHLASCLIWRKNSLVLGRSDFHWQHEPILYGWKQGAAHPWFGGRDKTTVLDFPRPARSEDHPTMKPVALVEAMLAVSTKAGKVVLDLFGGSGTTLVACERLGRSARLIELDPRFVDVIVRRWEELTGREATLGATNQSSQEVSASRSSVPLV